MRKLLILGLMLGLSGCTAMMLGGAGGYEPPPEDCSDEEASGRRCQS